MINLNISSHTQIRLDNIRIQRVESPQRSNMTAVDITDSCTEDRAQALKLFELIIDDL